jgi:hypothetical protein
MSIRRVGLILLVVGLACGCQKAKEQWDSVRSGSEKKSDDREKEIEATAQQTRENLARAAKDTREKGDALSDKAKETGQDATRKAKAVGREVERALK